MKLSQHHHRILILGMSYEYSNNVNELYITTLLSFEQYSILLKIENIFNIKYIYI